jgi:hypothetical protein
VLLDTGADYNLFNADLLEILGIPELKNDKRQDMFGIEGKGLETYFHDVIISIGGWKYKAYSGFTDFGGIAVANKMPYGILGQTGFLNISR